MVVVTERENRVIASAVYNMALNSTLADEYDIDLSLVNIKVISDRN